MQRLLCWNALNSPSWDDSLSYMTIDGTLHSKNTRILSFKGRDKQKTREFFRTQNLFADTARTGLITKNVAA